MFSCTAVEILNKLCEAFLSLPEKSCSFLFKNERVKIALKPMLRYGASTAFVITQMQILNGFFHGKPKKSVHFLGEPKPLKI